jgi:hypothetical protein
MVEWRGAALISLENDFTEAERWYRQGLAMEPENAAARRVLDRVNT